MNIFDIFAQLAKEKEEKQGGKPEYIIIGLGNPGKEYENTRHNCGFLTVDAIAKKYNVGVTKLKFKGLTGLVTIGKTPCLLLKPTTFMNSSGESLIEAMRYYKIPVEKVVVIYDDITLEPSQIRIRKKGSDGGHNGIKSILTYTDEGEFLRIKIGIGKKPHKEMKLYDWVLSKFSESDKPLIETAVNNAVSAVEMLVAGNADGAMNEYNH